MFGLFFTEQEKIDNFAQVSLCNIEQFKKFHHLMLEEGVYLAPSDNEAGFVSSAHSNEIIKQTINTAQPRF